MVEEVTHDHVPVVPAYARSVAFDLRSVYDTSSMWTEPPADMEDLVRTRVERQPDLLSISEAKQADEQLCRALKVQLNLKEEGFC